MAVLLITACNSHSDIDEAVEEGNAVYLQATATWGENTQSAKASTRAHWQSNRKFMWDNNSDQMAVLIANAGDVVPWGNRGYSYATVKKMADTEDGKSQASLKSNSGILKSDLDKLHIGTTPVYFFSPLSKLNGSDSEYSAETKCVTFSLPNEFSQTTTGKLDEFAPYTYIYAPSLISSVSKSTIEAYPSVFKGVPAVIHFHVVNEKNSQIKITKVEINLSAGGFSKTMKLDPINATLAPIGTDTYPTVTTNLGVAGTGDMVGEQADYYLYVFPTAAISGEEIVSSPFFPATGKFTLRIYEDEGKTPTPENLDNPENLTVYSTDLIDRMPFLSNHIYTCNLRVQDTSLTLLLDGIEVQTIPEWQAGVSESEPTDW